MANTHNLFWNQILLRSDAIADIDADAADAREQTLAQLASISEQFDRAFDPADAFEEYVAVALCQAVQRALTPKPAAMCKVSAKNLAAKPATTPSPSPSENAPAKPLQTVNVPKPRKSSAKKSSKNNGASAKQRGKTA